MDENKGCVSSIAEQKERWRGKLFVVSMGERLSDRGRRKGLGNQTLVAFPRRGSYFTEDIVSTTKQWSSV